MAVTKICDVRRSMLARRLRGGSACLFSDGLNCSPRDARLRMELTRARYDKDNGILAYNACQSFLPGEIRPERAHELGVRLAEKCWGKRFEVVIFTYMSGERCYNRFVVNAVSFMDGKKYYDNKASYALLRSVSDELCREYGLCVTEKRNSYSLSYGEWKKGKEAICIP